MQDVPLMIDYKGKQMTGFAVPLANSIQERPTVFDIIIDKAFLGTLRMNAQGWKMDKEKDPHLIELIGRYISAWYA